ncbi:hypothetical protein AB835_12540 [Candidatus Endobugula sertula]|uniref:Protease 3 n=1 Tax=Candidatus Endobugula sertula TaxID=62101 RepID=A0A1D2QMD8_9GAMM|nr:hypothetical protein AB835_12540 [Candidatus Endobugula sertula]
MLSFVTSLIRCAIVLCCIIALSPLPVVAADQSHATIVLNKDIKKGQIDQRKYHYLTLSNQLRVLLISDKDTDKAAASLDVNVGSMDDPGGRHGLAHFLEHMLFLGTKKYPVADEYQAFIDRNGGSHNAYTSGQHTNYFYDIKADKLEESLDRFSQFFVAPLFDEVYVDRERHAVHSEYQARIKDDDRRYYDLFKQMINPEHPFSNFSVGSLTTLANRPDDKVRDDLLTFYQQHYSSDRMALVVLGKESIPQLQKMVEQRFAQIPLREVKYHRPNVPLFTSGSLPIEVVSQPVQNIRQMRLSFPLPSVRAYYGEKPLRYIDSLLSHEGQGSMLSILKEKGWAEALSTLSGDIGAGNAVFDITIDLTEAGIQHRDKIRALLFHALDTIRQKGVEVWRYKEQQQLAKIDFQFLEAGSAINIVGNLANSLHYYPVPEVIRAQYLYSSFDAELIQRLLSRMTPENLYVSTVFPEAQTDNVTHHYQVPYTVNRLPKHIVNIPSGLKNQYQLPKKNLFVPQSGQLFPQDEKLSQPLATSIVVEGNDKESTLWVKQDLSFKVPKAHISLRLKSPAVSQSVRATAMADLLGTLIRDRLNESSYLAKIAGLSYGLYPGSRGFDLRISGYDDKMDVLLGMLVEEIKQPRLKLERFNNVKAELLRQLHNSKKQTPVSQLRPELLVTLRRPYWTDAQLAKALDTVTFEDIQQFSGQWLKGSQFQALFYGNIHQQTVEQWKTKITSLLLPGKQVITPVRVVKLAGDSLTMIKQQAISVDHNDKAVMLYVQAVVDTLEDQAKMVLLEQVLGADFFTQLRTEQQLGYIVYLTNLTIKDVPGLSFVVQSPGTSVDGIKSAVTRFLSQSIRTIPDDLSVYQRSAAVKLLKKPQQLSDQFRLYWQNILRGDHSFSYRQRLVNSIHRITPQQLRDYYQQTLLNKQRLLWVVADKSAVNNTSPLFSKSQPSYIYP